MHARTLGAGESRTIMKREELAEHSQRERRRQMRGMALAMALFAVWLPGLYFIGNRLDWMGAASLSIVIFSAYAALPVIGFVTMGINAVRRMPKCPHCGIRFYWPLLATAVATGNCGHCGRSIES